MNCRPGDLAFVIRGAVSSGRIVRCISLLKANHVLKSQCGKLVSLPHVYWQIEGWVSYKTVTGEIVEVAACRDEFLRPIRDPGDDAVDESHAYLPPVPTHQKEPA